MIFPLVHPATGLAMPLRGDERTRTAASVPTTETTKAPQGWVYLISDGGWAYKIGWARNPEKRLAFLQTGHPEKLRIVAVIDGSREKERELHELFAASRIRGEWFVQDRELTGYFEDHGNVCICPGYRRKNAPVDAECFIHGEGLPAW